MKGKIIAVDFDGTCVTHEYPYIGRDIGAVPVLKRIIESGNRIILYTMRGHKLADASAFEIDLLDEAIEWFKENGVPLYDVNINPNQHEWTTSNKCIAHIYIDDAALGIPLIDNGIDSPYVDWKEVEKLLEELGVIV